MALTKRADAILAVGLAALIGAGFGVGAHAANEIAPDAVVFGEDGEVAASVTGTDGDPLKGREWFADRKLGNCLACHVNSDMNELPFHGEVGPTMDGVAERYDAAQLRGIIVNSKKTFGDQTIMPSFYRLENGARTAEKFEGKAILTAAEVEDVVAYLLTLKE